MKLYARLENENGKIETLGGNKYIRIELTIGNKKTAVIWHDNEVTKILKEKAQGQQCYCQNSGLSIPHYKDDH
jgi:hypothetical protein